MAGSFSLRLLEIFAYLLPGVLVTGIALVILWPNGLPQVAETAVGQFALVATAYVSGHLLTILSLPLVRIRGWLKNLLRAKGREQRLAFYPSLREYLGDAFGVETTRTDEYRFCRHLVSEKLPSAAAEIERIYALTLFSRNLVVSFLISAIVLRAQFLPCILAALAAVGFFVRYVQLEHATTETVFRSAFVYFRIQAYEGRGGQGADEALSATRQVKPPNPSTAPDAQSTGVRCPPVSS